MSHAQKSKRHGRRRDKGFDDKRVKTGYRYVPARVVRVVRR